LKCRPREFHSSNAAKNFATCLGNSEAGGMRFAVDAGPKANLQLPHTVGCQAGTGAQAISVNIASSRAATTLWQLRCFLESDLWIAPLGTPASGALISVNGVASVQADDNEPDSVFVVLRAPEFELQETSRDTTSRSLTRTLWAHRA
jgi:hypothetical protein